MATARNYPVNSNFDLMNIMHIVAQDMTAQGYSCQVTPMGPQAGSLVVSKDRDGFQNIIGMGLECRVTFTLITPAQLTVSIDSEWTNKIIALVVGWFCCLVPLVTGAIGAYNQSELPNKIFNSINMALATANSGATGFSNPNYGYQPPVNNYNQNDNFNQNNSNNPQQ